MNKEDSFDKPNIVKQQIQEITKRLEELEIKHKKESDLIKEELASIRQSLVNVGNAIPDQENSRTIQIGSTAQITNNYKGEYDIG